MKIDSRLGKSDVCADFFRGGGLDCDVAVDTLLCVFYIWHVRFLHSSKAYRECVHTSRTLLPVDFVTVEGGGGESSSRSDSVIGLVGCVIRTM